MIKIIEETPTPSFESLLPKIPILENFKIIQKIGQGSFGSIYYAYLKKSNKKTKSNFPWHYAVKIEMFDSKSAISLANRTLGREAKFLYLLKENIGFPNIFYCRTFDDRTILIMDKLGENLEIIFNQCKRVFSLQTVILIALQSLARLEVLSAKGIVHRDMKPDNLMLSSSPNRDSLIYLIDFGLSKKIINDNNQHIDCEKGVGLVGTPRYTSVNSHLGIQQSRRDDLESLGYILIYFLKGKLPWMMVNLQKQFKALISSVDKNNMILKIKQQTSIENLCSNLPSEFLEYFKYVKGLKFNEEPDYKMLMDKFKKVLKNPQEKLEFDWETKINGKKATEPEINITKAMKIGIKNNNSENNEKMASSNENLGKTDLIWKFSSKKTSRIPKKSIFYTKSEDYSEENSVEDKINANFLNDVSTLDDALDICNQKTISRKIIFQPIRNSTVKKHENSARRIDKELYCHDLEDIEEDEIEIKQNLGFVMKFLSSDIVKKFF